ncbi:trypsin-like peptidase domain-containing protein [Luteolibacter sp. Populi]|uniref:trypsin-like peptidase domain-containing protein n=1 Tax=Luteolibacter sp. Populi TaxID=3230487 RepID=UPI003466AA71
MQQGIQRLLALAAVFAVAFSAVYLIRNGSDGITRLFDPRGGSGQEHRPEHATMPDRPAMPLGEVELLALLDTQQTKLLKAVVPSVVSIDTAGIRSERLLDGFGRERGVRRVPTQGQGSGVIVSEEGHVLTNRHVIEGQRQIQITLNDGKAYGATLIGQDPLLDVAVLKIDAPGEKFRPLKFGDSTQVGLAQSVFAIGNPFGLGETVTKGIISAVERTLSDTQRDLFQTDAAINPGNSGGPLINIQGEIIGINSSIYTPDKANPGFQGVGFSIPSNDVKDALFAILERGRPIRGYLGLKMVETRAGVQVISVAPGGPAEAAGLKPDDVVQSYDGESIRTINQLVTLVQRTRIGRKVPLIVDRDGKAVPLEATITESLPETGTTTTPSKMREPAEVLQAIGVIVNDLSPQDRKAGLSGVVVAGVQPGGLAAGQLQAGDLITAVNRIDIRNSYEFYLHLSASAGVQPTSIRYMREGKYGRADLPAVPRKEEE